MGSLKKKDRVNVCFLVKKPSDFPDFAQFLVEEGIDSISVTPDSLVKTIYAMHSIENQLPYEKVLVALN